MPDIQKGLTFSGTSPNNSVTAEKLNTLVDSATILTGFYTGKSEATSALDADYLLFYEASSGAFRKILKGNLITAARAQTGFRNFYATNNAGNPNTQVDVLADEVVMRNNVADTVWRSGGLNATLDISVYSGGATANGRDFATLTSTDGQWCGIWAISNGGLDRVLLSQADTPFSSPNLPAGYSYQALLTVVWITPIGQLVRFSARGNEVAVDVPSNATTAAATRNPYIGASEFTALQVNATARTFSQVSLARCVPRLASRVRGMIGCTANSAAVTDGLAYGLATKGAGTTIAPTESVGLQMLTVFCQAAGTGASFGFFGATQFEIGVGATRTIAAAVNGTGSVHSMRINGYTLNL